MLTGWDAEGMGRALHKQIPVTDFPVLRTPSPECGDRSASIPNQDLPQLCWARDPAASGSAGSFPAPPFPQRDARALMESSRLGRRAGLTRARWEPGGAGWARTGERERDLFLEKVDSLDPQESTGSLQREPGWQRRPWKRVARPGWDADPAGKQQGVGAAPSLRFPG